MSEGDPEPAKVISRERRGDTMFVTIEVSSIGSFRDYKSHNVGLVTKVRASDSCPPEDRTLIKQACYYSITDVYEPGKDEDHDDQPPLGGDQGESSATGQEKKRKIKEEDGEEKP